MESDRREMVACQLGLPEMLFTLPFACSSKLLSDDQSVNCPICITPSCAVKLVFIEKRVCNDDSWGKKHEKSEGIIDCACIWPRPQNVLATYLPPCIA